MLKNLGQLQFLTTVPEYRALNRSLRDHKRVPGEEHRTTYWPLMPDYVIARCPHCGAPYTEKLDTYSLEWWSRPHGDCVFSSFGKAIGQHCEHLFLTGVFLHLQGLMPEIQRGFICEVPHVIPCLLGEAFDCRAVLHALPVCRIEGEQFVPRYQAYFINYFAPRAQHQALNDEINAQAEQYRLRYDYIQLIRPNSVSYSLGERPERWWGLKPWVEQGKLAWLEPDTPDLPLRTGPAEAFPYADIAGRIHPYEVTLPVTEQKLKMIRYHIDEIEDDMELAEYCSVPVEVIRGMRG